ncbi:ABC transporter permease [Nocardioides terrisoli]|uniref:ABC transporter permease n=1 Tax=Nocardioides terrisoli TaxID=3388267 RepID=UPI00287BBAC4|nr:ABC transporter permease [Nocardioides marmorisolisilvae]
MRAANKASGPGSDQKGRRADAAKRARRLARAKAESMPVVAAFDGPRLERRVDAPLVQPAPHGGIIEVLRQPYLLRLIVSRLLASMYAASLLGLLWSYIQPAMRFAIYFVVFGFVFNLHQGFPSFAIHLFCGIVFVHYFTETWSGGTRSIWQNRSLVMKMRMPRETFPVAAMVVAAYHTFPQILVLIFICVLSGWHISISGIIAALLGVGILVCISLALGLFFSALNVFYKDFQNIVQTLLQFLHFMVPMMYPFSRIYQLQHVHPWLYQVYMANPVAEAVLLMQRFFWWGVVPANRKQGSGLIQPGGGHTVEFPPDLFERGLVMLVACAVLLYFAQRFFSRVEGKFPERM